MAREAGMNPQEAAKQVALGLKQSKYLDCVGNGLENRAKRQSNG
jgi:hypothetical protein